MRQNFSILSLQPRQRSGNTSRFAMRRRHRRMIFHAWLLRSHFEAIDSRPQIDRVIDFSHARTDPNRDFCFIQAAFMRATVPLLFVLATCQTDFSRHALFSSPEERPPSPLAAAHKAVLQFSVWRFFVMLFLLADFDTADCHFFGVLSSGADAFFWHGSFDASIATGL